MIGRDWPVSDEESAECLRPADPHAFEHEGLRKERPLRIDEAQSSLHIDCGLLEDGVAKCRPDRLYLRFRSGDETTTNASGTRRLRGATLVRTELNT